MSIAQRKDGRWIVKYKNPVSGKWVQKAFRDEVPARAFNDEIAYDAVENTRLTVRECVTLFLQNVTHCADVGKQYSFIVNGYDRKNGTHTEGPAEFLADKYCMDLTRRDLENFRQHCRERGNSIGRINAQVSCLKTAMNWASEQDLIPSNPWAKYKALPGHKVKHREGSLEDFQRVYALLSPRMQWACRTCLALCLRPGKELFYLEWSAFDWQGRFVKVHMFKVDRDKIVYPPEAYLEEAWQRYQTDKEAGQTLVCRNKFGRLLSYWGFRSSWGKALKKAGVKMPLYAMRHIAASQMLYSGADIAAVAAQLGHSSIATTASTYVHAIAAGQRRAAQGIPLVQLGAENGKNAKINKTKTNT